jgi:large subunit ribosomal protein L1
MPNPKSGTVTFDIQKAVEEIKSGRVEFRVDKTAIVHSSVGKLSFHGDKLEENIKVFLQAIVQSKPAAAKGRYIKNIHLSSTMGPSLQISESVLEK